MIRFGQTMQCPKVNSVEVAVSLKDTTGRFPKRCSGPLTWNLNLNPERHTRADPSIKYEQLWNEVENRSQSS